MEYLSLNWTKNLETNEEETDPREVIEAKNILGDIFKLDDRLGAKTTLTLGTPGSCKTAVDCHFVKYCITQQPKVKIFWRSSMGAPIQIFKLPKWHIYIEQDSGVRLFNRHSGRDCTKKFIDDGKVTYFKTFKELYRKAKPGICNGVFFKDLHLKGIPDDKGNLQWLRFYRTLLDYYDWSMVVFDEIHELCKAGSGGRMWHEIRKFSDDLSNARKSNLITHGNAHQTSELDSRVVDSIMIFMQMYGSKKYKHNMVTKQAVAGLPKPNRNIGAWCWISEGGRYGRWSVPEIYELPYNMSISAKIVGKYEKTKVCPVCHHIFVYKNVNKVYCSRTCEQKAYIKRKEGKKKKKVVRSRKVGNGRKVSHSHVPV